MKDDSDFYIGWQDKAPPKFAKPVRWLVIGLAVLIPTLAIVLVWQQRGFSGALFEYGQLSVVEGQLIRQPVPFLRIPVKGSTAANPLYKRILLIGPGKHGADATLNQWEAKYGQLTHKQVKIQGILIYHEGKAALELTEASDALLQVSTSPTPPIRPTSVALGQLNLQGELMDPKCFLGVMKPGYGRPHRSCAIRCIAGGIPPLLYVDNGQGQRNGYLIVGEKGDPIRNQILAFVGKSVQIRGRLELADNWLILYVNMPVDVVQQLPDVTAHIALCQ